MSGDLSCFTGCGGDSKPVVARTGEGHELEVSDPRTSSNTAAHWERWGSMFLPGPRYGPCWASASPAGRADPGPSAGLPTDSGLSFHAGNPRVASFKLRLLSRLAPFSRPWLPASSSGWESPQVRSGAPARSGHKSRPDCSPAPSSCCPFRTSRASPSSES